MESITRWLFDTTGLAPHGFCLALDPWLIWLHVLSNVAIGVAYLSIPVALTILARRRRDLVFRPLFWLFAAFIGLCGAGHWLNLLTLWVPAYGIEGVVKAVTGIVSLATAAVVWRLLPQTLSLPSPRILREALAAARASEMRHRAFFHGTPVAMHILDDYGRIIAVSDRWLALLGFRREEVIGRPSVAFQDPTSAAAAAQDRGWLLAGEAIDDVPRRFIHRDGRILDVLVSKRIERGPGGEEWIVTVLADVTAARQAEVARAAAEDALRESEEKLRRTQRMEALGQLAGGVAHDFNNVLQAVLGGARLLRRRRSEPEAVERLANLVTEAAERGASVARRLLAIARRGELRAEPVDPREMLAGLNEVLAYTLGAGVRVEVVAPLALPPLLADRGQLETSLVNLATNARDAMVGQGGGTLTLSAEADCVEASREPHPAGLIPGAYVRISVADTGEGMDAATLLRATEPFFTTKPRGAGTGLGLPMAKGLAEQSGGALAIESAPGRGTTVTMWLPVAASQPTEAAPSEPEPPAAQPAEPEAAASVGPLALVVDDEPGVREVIAEGLGMLGWRVREAESGVAALAAISNGLAPTVLITDLAMPGMDGLALVQEVRRLHPGMPALLVTGFAGDITSGPLAAALAGGPFSVLRKPLTLEDLSARAAALVESSSADRRSKTMGSTVVPFSRMGAAGAR